MGHIAGAFELYLESSSWVWGAYMDSSDEDKALWREDREFLNMLDLTPEKVEEMGMNALKDFADEEMKKGMDEKEPMVLLNSWSNSPISEDLDRDLKFKLKFAV